MTRVGYLGRMGKAQATRLESGGCERIQIGSLDDAIALMGEGDILVIPQLAALGATPSAIARAADKPVHAKVSLVSIDDHIDTTNVEDAAFFTHAKALHVATRKSAKAREAADKGGRPKADLLALERASEMRRAGNCTVAEACAACGVSRTTFYRYIAEHPKPGAT